MAMDRAIDRRLLAIPIAVVIGLALAACSPSGSAGSDGGAGAAPVETSTVDLPASYRFAPEDIAVPVGTTVTWTNNDHFTHSVQFLGGGLPVEPLLMQPGASTSFTFAALGTYAYHCHLHPQDMRGTVTVTP